VGVLANALRLEEGCHICHNVVFGHARRLADDGAGKRRLSARPLAVEPAASARAGQLCDLTQAHRIHSRVCRAATRHRLCGVCTAARLANVAPVCSAARSYSSKLSDCARPSSMILPRGPCTRRGPCPRARSMGARSRQVRRPRTQRSRPEQLTLQQVGGPTRCKPASTHRRRTGHTPGRLMIRDRRHDWGGATPVPDALIRCSDIVTQQRRGVRGRLEARLTGDEARIVSCPDAATRT
jgi:hypothetical protein